jgi:hypothetical protein
MKKVLVVGYLGNMGKRYTTILEYLGIDWVGVDYKIWGNYSDSKGKLKMLPKKFPQKDVDGIIIATPTNTHLNYLRTYKNAGVPLLCEKPITKDLLELAKVIDELGKSKTKVSMVNQYSYLQEAGTSGPTIYNYFKHGGDGLYWDCIQPIGLAKDAVLVGEDSPVWTCFLNGHKISLADMDAAYIEMMSDWVRGKHKTDLNELYRIHEKVAEMEARRGA